MPEFLIELYVSRADTVTVDHSIERARRAAEELSREGTLVRYLRSIFVPEDESCFFLYEAARAEDVEEAARRASLRLDRAVAAVAERTGQEEL